MIEPTGTAFSIKGLRIEPDRHPELTVRRAKMFVTKHGVADIDVEQSLFPLEIDRHASVRSALLGASSGHQPPVAIKAKFNRER
jgi:hypothetical protein